MRKQILSMLLCLAMFFGTIPTGMSAEGEQGIQNGVQMKEGDEKNNVIGAMLARVMSGDECAHDDVTVDENGNVTCNICSESMAMKVEHNGETTYKTDVNEAVASAENGSKLTIIAEKTETDINDGLYVPDNAEITLDINGHSLSRALRVGKTNSSASKLIIRDTAGNGSVGFYVWNGGAVEFDPGNDFTTISEVQFYGGEIKLYGGNIKANSWIFGEKNKANLTDMLPEGYAYRDYYGLGSYGEWIKKEELQNDNVVRYIDLAVRKCPHECESVSINGSCEYCGSKFAAGIGGTFYKSLLDALNEAENATDNPVIKMYDSDYLSGPGGVYLFPDGKYTIDLNNKDLNLLKDSDSSVVVTLVVPENTDLTLISDGNSIVDSYLLVRGKLTARGGVKIGANATVSTTDGVSVQDGGTLNLEKSDRAKPSVGVAVFVGNNGTLNAAAVRLSHAVYVKDGGTVYVTSDDVVFPSSYTIGEGALNVTNGTLIASGGDFTKTIIGENGNAELSGGSYFDGIEVRGENRTLNDLLKKGCSFADYDGNAQNGNTQSLQRVKIILHTKHAYSGSLNLDIHCTVCGARLQAVTGVIDDTGSIVPNAYFENPEEAFASLENDFNGKVLICTANNFKFERNIDVNSKYVDFSSIMSDIKMEFAAGCSFVVKDGARMSVGNLFATDVTVESGADFAMADAGKVGTLTVMDGSKMFERDNGLQGGKCEKIIVNAAGKTVGDITRSNMTGEDYTYRFEDGTWADDSDLQKQVIEHVSVAKKPFKNETITSSTPLVQEYNGKNEVKLKAEKTDPYMGNYGETTYEWFRVDSDENRYALGVSSAEITESLTAVGTYKYLCQITRGGYTRAVTAEVTINKAEAQYTQKPAAKALTYSGNEQELVAAGAASGGTIMYSTDGTTWDTAIPKAKKAAEYSVFYKIAGDSNHSDSQPENMKVTIAPYKLKGISADSITKKYDGTTDLPEEISVKGFIGDSDDSIVTLHEDDYTLTGSYSIAAADSNNTVNLKIKLNNTNYIFDNGSDEKEFTLTAYIKKALPISIEDKEFTIIKKQEHTYTLDLNEFLPTLTGTCEYGNIKYIIQWIDLELYYNSYEGAAEIDENGILSLPIQKHYASGNIAGDIIVMIETDNYEDMKLRIDVMAESKYYLLGKPTLSKKTLTYGETLSEITLSGNMYDDRNNADVAGTFSWEKPSEKPGVGSYDAHWEFIPDDFRYDTAWGRANITVSKADSSYTAPTANVLIYNGGEQELITAGSTDDGTMEYSVDNINWSSAIPKKTYADDYVVYYRVAGDENHNDSAVMHIDVVIEKLPVEISWSGAENLVYDNTEKTIAAAISNKAQNDVVNLRTDGVFTATNKGIYTAKVIGVDNENYTVNGGKNLIKEWSIAQADDNSITGLAISGWTYGDKANKPASQAKYGTPTYIYSAEKDSGYSDAVPSDAGTYWVKAIVSATENYAEVSSAPVSFTIEQKDISNAAVGTFEKMTYSGKPQTPKADVTADGLAVSGTWSEVTNVSDTTTFTANGNFKGTIANVAAGMARKNIKDAVITLDGALTYNGSEQTQNVKVALDELTVTYDVSDNKATDVKPDGDYTLTVAGNGNFEGTKTAAWNISKAAPVQNAEKKTTASVPRGRTLAVATLTKGEMLAVDGTTPLDGTFEWADAAKVVSEDGTEQIKFIPSNKNYGEVTFDVEVSTYSVGGGGGSSSATSYNVKFETNGGTEIETRTVRKNNTLSEPSAPQKDGFEFGGWFTDKELKNKYNFNAKVTKSFTLYASWTKIETDPEPTDKPTDEPKDEPKDTKPGNKFDDVSEDDWYYDDVNNAVESGLFKGTDGGRFDPNAAVTRGMFVTVLYRAEGEPPTNKSIPFADIESGAYYANAVVWAEQNDIVEGISETEFAPNENITREQMAAVIYRYANYKGYDTAQGGMAIREFSDFDEISEYALSPMTYAVNTGLIKGKTDTTINPKDFATRAEIAAIMNRVIAANK